MAPAVVRFAAGVITGLLILLMLAAAPAQAAPDRAATDRAAAPQAAPARAAGARAGASAGYRYWSFWKWSDGTWAYQQQGPAVYVPRDGGVDGWRFAVSPDGGRDAARPGGSGDFATICGSTPDQSGRKRIAVVLDFGTAADAAGETPPERRTACAVVPANATSAEVLATVAPPLRYDTNGLLCAIAGYPKSGCGDRLGAAAQPTAQVTDGSGPGSGGGTEAGSGDGGAGPDIGLIAGAALVAVLAAGAVRQTRRRR
ncbi:SCO2322 family protein [Kitasatospora sp. CM 4170]|uniref:SCO2322 family protein n=1 Tax=Kitasatospora aburaviensis TaxID=67265 RepID=A0ABW1F2Q9_9ACTN|nr:SCO2322 family protein [Kitasatospora sp. CM 4170]WNM45492.1 SCO2322 family protein [Kitasatospora sp. CM 4170]